MEKLPELELHWSCTFCLHSGLLLHATSVGSFTHKYASSSSLFFFFRFFVMLRTFLLLLD